MKSEQLNQYLEVKQKTDRDVRQLGVLVSESYEADSTDQQLVINLNFSVDLSNKKQIWLFIDGQKLVEGSTSNYTFTNVVSNVSAQITLNAPLIAGLPIQAYKLGAYQESFPNPSSVTATLLNDVAQPHKMALDAFQPFVYETSSAPTVTSIINRAPVKNGNLKAIAGVERIMCRSIVQSRTEFGSNGEPVFELDSKESRIRFVGSAWISSNDVNGSKIYSNVIGDSVEVVFYGTGLNMLSFFAASTDVRATIDAGSEGTNLWATTTSTILNGRNYSQNTVLPVAAGLTLGWHTIKIRNASAVALYCSGFEILNQRTDLAVLAGEGYAGMKQSVLASLSTSAFNAGVTGTRGARVVKYIKDNVISQVVTNVNGASAYLTSADHTNEEVVRKINFREFGANRADDFSTLSTSSSRAFTLDDGTTTLTGLNAIAGVPVSGAECVRATTGGFLTITFVGTGLDVVLSNNDAGGRTTTVFVDGSSVGTVVPPANIASKVSLCSGLPYGSHTVKFNQTTGDTLFIVDFLIYQPKKPAIPLEAIEVADYNVVANFAANTTAGFETIATGVLRKQLSLREATFVGTWALSAIDLTSFIPGFTASTSTIASYMEYTFFGTGFEIRNRCNTTFSGNITLSIDGSANWSSYTSSVYGGYSIVSSTTGQIGQSTSVTNGSGLRVSGLALGKHTVRLTVNTAASMQFESFDVITPIHINNTKIGSLSLKDSRAFSPLIDKPNVIDMSKAKAWVCFDGTNSKILSSFNISQVLKSGAGNYYAFFEKPFKNANYVAFMTGDNWQNIASASPGTGKNPNMINFTCSGSTGTQVDGTVSLILFGELEDEIDGQF